MKRWLPLLLLLIASPVAAQVATVGGQLPQLPSVLGGAGGLKVECLVGCSAGGGVTDTDDNSIATGQIPGVSIALNYIYDGSVWRRRLFGIQTSALSQSVTFASDVSALHTICDSGCGSPAATADGTAFSFGTTNVTPIAFVVDDVASTTVTENSYGAARMTGSRILYQDLSKSASNTNSFKVDFGGSGQPITNANLDVALSTRLKPADTLTAVTTVGTITNVVHVDDNAGSLTVDGAVTANAGTNLNTSALTLDATVTNRFPAAANPANGETNTANVSRLGSYNFVYNGSTWDRWTGAVTLASTTVTGTVATAEVAPTTLLNGKTTVTTAGTRVVLASSTTAKSVTIKALIANTGSIYVGSATVSSANGYVLLPGDSVSVSIANLNTVNIDSSVNGEGVTYIGVN